SCCRSTMSYRSRRRGRNARSRPSASSRRQWTPCSPPISGASASTANSTGSLPERPGSAEAGRRCGRRPFCRRGGRFDIAGVRGGEGGRQRTAPVFAIKQNRDRAGKNREDGEIGGEKRAVAPPLL